MEIGYITSIFPEKKYGFIRNNKHPNGVFFHFNQITDKKQFSEMRKGSMVLFNIRKMHNEKTEAVDVELYTDR